MNCYTKDIPILAWHGTKTDGTSKYLVVKEIVGIKTYLAGDVVLCENALHGSLHAVDTLRFSEGLWFKRTLHEGIVVKQPDKIGSSERTLIAEANATQVASDWAFWCADRAMRIHAVAALRQAGMSKEAEKLVNLEAVTDKKSAYIAADTAARAAAVRTAVLDAVRAVLSAAAADSAAYAAYAIRSAAVHTAHAAADPVHGVRAADSADIAEMSFLNIELERRLFILMGITEKEGLA